MSVFKKLNLKDQKEIVVLGAPSAFETELSHLDGVAIRRDLNHADKVGFSLAFVTRQKDLDALAPKVAEKAEGDAIVWFAYPKGTSKNFKCDFNRDTGWKVLGRAGFEGVRQVAIDEDWSALRFRRAEFIKSIKRDPKRALSPAGKKRTKAKVDRG